MPTSPRVRVATVAFALLGLALPAAPPVAAQSGEEQPAGVLGAGTEDRRWVEGEEDPPISPAEFDVVVRENETMQVRDGTTLKVDIYLPDAEGPFPCLLIQEGYGKDGAVAGTAIPMDFASRGYGVVQADIRGMGSSEGQWEPFIRRQQEDGYDLVEWTAAQDFCTGKVGTFGTSYMAIDQMLMAKLLPPSLGAMIPVQGWGDAYLGWHYKGGMKALEDPIVYLMLEQALLAVPPPDGDGGAYLDHLSNAPAPRVLASWNQNTTFNDFWRERSTLAEDHEAILEHGVAVLMQAGWNDVFLYPMMKMYREFADAADSPDEASRIKLVVGPWTHGGEDGVLPYDFQAFRVQWFDRWLKGIENGIDQGPRVLMNVQGADAWRWEDDWPIPDAKSTRFYLHAEQAGGARSINDGTLSPEAPSADEATASYPYTPTQVAGGGALLGGQSPQDQRIDETRSLTWSTPPLEDATELTGPITFTFWASSTAADTDFVARVVEVAADGTATQMTRGWLKATHRDSHSEPTPLEPGELYRFEVEVWPNSNVFDAGNRIRIDLSGADLPLMEPNPNPAVVTVVSDAEHPSYVEFDVVGAPKLLPADAVVTRRLAGRDRVRTAIAVSRRAHPDGAPAVVLARADDYADALAGAPLAADLDAPLLLTPRDGLADQVVGELQRLEPDRVVLLGGPAALSPQVAADLAELLPAADVERVAGADRFATAAALADRLGAAPGTAYVVEGVDDDPARGWPDAVSVASLAAAQGRPILLVDTNTVPPSTAAALRRHAREVVVVGGAAAVSDATLAMLGEGGVATSRIAGPDRYATSRAVREAAIEAGADASEVWLATGGTFPDALTAGPAVAAAGATLLLVDGADLTASPTTAEALDAAVVDRVVFLGGRAAISARVEDQVRALLAPGSDAG